MTDCLAAATTMAGEGASTPAEKAAEEEQAPTVSGDGKENNKAEGEQGETDKTAQPETSEAKEMITFKVSHGRDKQYEIEAPLDQKISDFKQKVFELTGITPAMQKLFYHSIKFKDDATLEECKVKNGAKILLMGSTVAELVAANTKPKPEEIAQAELAAKTKEPLCQQKPHSTYIEKGVPEDAMPGIKNSHDALPSAPLRGMKDGKGRSVRLTFKLELDQIWIGTAERTQKIPMGSVSEIAAERITGHEEYYMIGFKVGTTEASRIWVYWVPAQYVTAIKRAVLN